MSEEITEEHVEQTDKEAVLDPEFKKDVAQQLLLMKEEQKAEAIRLKEAEKAIPKTWNLSAKGLESVKKTVAMYNTEYGLYASIPMICKGEECIYAQLFPEMHDGLSEAGERCPVEVAMIISKYDSYMKELEITKEDAVDMSILRDVIDYDIQIMRAENKMAIEGDFVQDVVVSVTEKGVPITQEQISKSAEYKDKIQTKRNKALEMLHSTRKDKAGTKLNVVMDPSTYAKNLMKSAQESATPIEGIFEELDIIPDIEYDDGSGK